MCLNAVTSGAEHFVLLNDCSRFTASSLVFFTLHPPARGTPGPVWTQGHRCVLWGHLCAVGQAWYRVWGKNMLFSHRWVLDLVRISDVTFVFEVWFFINGISLISDRQAFEFLKRPMMKTADHGRGFIFPSGFHSGFLHRFLTHILFSGSSKISKGDDYGSIADSFSTSD